MDAYEEILYEALDRILRDIAEECIPEARASDEYKEERAKRKAYFDTLRSMLTEGQWGIFMEADDQTHFLASLEETVMRRKIFFYGLAQGIKIGRRSENGR
jgi:hypothetical protein